jgi:hypothetical protein
MADHGFDDGEPPRRARRGPPPRLYIIARKSPFPWLRVRRLGEADRTALVSHFNRLAATARSGGRGAPDAAGIADLCAGLDFGRMVAFGAIAGNAVIAAACGVPGLRGLQVAATEDPDYREHDLGAMLASQVLGAGPGAIALAPCPGTVERDLLRLIRSFGARVEQGVERDGAPDLALDLAQSA